ncbi:disease resistance protein RUN1-like [Rutidosis leptorrhynchoides]|uniref:disease resistance protein RUN1-like n=1 Tax=Rutidosis leptorrhynchoides TaxID=125765 RepID=UPI003A98DE2F
MENSSPKSITYSHKWSYDVFVSFGDDTITKSFVDHLFSAFKRKGIRAFKEDEHMNIGEERFPQIYSAIEQSRFLVVIFSNSYASSPLCLRKLVKILECKEKEPHKYLIRTVFYHITPEMVVKQIESVDIIFKKYESEGKTEVTRLKEALTKAANLPGWDLKVMANGYESKFIDMISKHLFNELNVGPLHIGEKLVGVHLGVERMNLQHFTWSSEVHMIGICGITGIGKTTIAKAIYNRLYAHFDICSFCENVKEIVEKHGMIQLQKQVIEDITKEDLKVSSVGEGSNVLKRIMISKKVLLILDDVDELDYLEALAGSINWFGPGSLILITGKNRQLLNSHGVENIYEVEPLQDDVAMELFSLYAFKQKQPKEEFKGLSDQVVGYMKGHPLTLKVLGCFLFSKSLSEWKSELSRLGKNPIDDVQVLISRYSLNKKRNPA